MRFQEFSEFALSYYIPSFHIFTLDVCDPQEIDQVEKEDFSGVENLERIGVTDDIHLFNMDKEDGKLDITFTESNVRKRIFKIEKL